MNRNNRSFSSRAISRALLLLITVVMLAAALPFGYAAATDSETSSLTIEYLDEDRPLSGVEFRIFFVADTLEHGAYGLAEEYADCDAALFSQMTNSDWETAADKFAQYIAVNNISPDAKGSTDSDGKLTFTGLEDGLYYIEGNSLNDGITIYSPQHFCVVLPDRTADGLTRFYFVTVQPKHTESPAPRFGDLTITKTVSGDAGETDREWHFTVTLGLKVSGRFGDLTFRNGIAEFTLKHGEKQTAKRLPAGTSYAVSEVEADADGYTTTMTGETGIIGADTTVTAAFVNNREPEPSPTPSTEPAPSIEPTPTNEPDSPNTAPPTQDPPNDSEIPPAVTEPTPEQSGPPTGDRDLSEDVPMTGVDDSTPIWSITGLAAVGTYMALNRIAGVRKKRL